MTYLLDTNVISELRKRNGSQAVKRWVQESAEAGHYLSAITILELEVGVRRIERRDPPQGQVLRRWLDERVLVAFADRVLAIDAEVAHEAARLHVPDPRPERDALIAATAIAHTMTIATRNVRDFASLSAPVINPWE